MGETTASKWLKGVEELEKKVNEGMIEAEERRRVEDGEDLGGDESHRNKGERKTVFMLFQHGTMVQPFKT